MLLGRIVVMGLPVGPGERYDVTVDVGMTVIVPPDGKAISFVSASNIQLTVLNLHNVVVSIEPVGVIVGWPFTALLVIEVGWGTSVEPEGL